MAITDSKRLEQFKRLRNILLLVLVLNWGVAAAKIAFGLLAHFSSMVADGFHSLSDGTSNIIGLIGIYISYQPVDPEHPYGHKKYETLFSMGIGMLLLFISFNVLREGFARFNNPVEAAIEPVTFAVMLITLGVNFLVMRYELTLGKKFKSDILVSDSMHTKADIFTSISVILALAVTKLGFPVVDPIVTVGISLFIAHAAWDIFRESSQVLCDSAVILDQNKISAIVLNVKGVKNCHRIRTRGRGDDIHVDLHVTVNPNMHVDEAHRISRIIEAELQKGIPGVTDVIVHVEPKDEGSEPL